MSPKRARQLQVVAYFVIGIGVLLAFLDTGPGVGAMLVSVAAGALLIALALFFGRPAVSTPTVDSFRNIPPTDVINAAHIRVAGVGGLGLVLISALIAIQFPRVGMSVIAGLAGGVPLAFYLFRRHRQQRNHDAATNGPGGRSVFPVTDGAAAEKRSAEASVESSRSSSDASRLFGVGPSAGLAVAGHARTPVS